MRRPARSLGPPHLRPRQSPRSGPLYQTVPHPHVRSLLGRRSDSPAAPVLAACLGLAGAVPPVPQREGVLEEEGALPEEDGAGARVARRVGGLDGWAGDRALGGQRLLQ